jgi:hypothetical protein
MTFSEFCSWLEGTSLALRIGESWWFPLLESIHVVAVVFVVGSILMVDLRLIGVAARVYAVSRIAGELIPWTWMGFAISVVTGAGLFVTRASHYAGNPAFQAKLLLMAFAGINMGLFHFVAFRGVTAWDTVGSPPRSAKIFAALSLSLWSGVVLAGRWVGHLS